MSKTTHYQTREAQVLAGGIVAFAAVMLIIGSLLNISRGIMAIAKDDIFVTTPNYTFELDVSTWGWIHLILGVLALLVGFSLFKARLWARIIGVILAGLLLIASFLSLPYYPIWSVILIALYGFVIWALCVVKQDTLA